MNGPSEGKTEMGWPRRTDGHRRPTFMPGLVACVWVTAATAANPEKMTQRTPPALFVCVVFRWHEAGRYFFGHIAVRWPGRDVVFTNELLLGGTDAMAPTSRQAQAAEQTASAAPPYEDETATRNSAVVDASRVHLKTCPVCRRAVSLHVAYGRQWYSGHKNVYGQRCRGSYVRAAELPEAIDDTDLEDFIDL